MNRLKLRRDARDAAEGVLLLMKRHRFAVTELARHDAEVDLITLVAGLSQEELIATLATLAQRIVESGGL
jgi:hypothetical protein